ncbi:Ssb Single-stranded DNA-binding protein [uncultured Caudovirales phage]|uniref:Single-stranded DNA-binding protein n=1 Tax=uncultured Caudovirales phage TaxID=2100421 RepID=A0A6J5LGE1_9CAUD|nr:Ssb Single-stranded DNA-binding protein [uncultured Caudovirales phage]
MSNNFSAVVTLGKDAETRQAGSSTVTSFSGANNIGHGDKKQTLWIKCSVWGDRGSKSAQYLLKGGQVWVSGELSTREYEGKTYFELNVSQFNFVGKKTDAQPSQVDPQNNQNAGDYNDDVPF